MYNMIHINNTAVCYIWKLLRVNPKSSHKKKNFFSIYLCTYMRWSFTKLTVIIISRWMLSQTIMLYTLNLYSAECQSYPNKTRGKKRDQNLTMSVNIKIIWKRDFPSSPVFETLSSNAGGVGLIPGQGAKIPHASWPKNQNIKQKQYCKKFKKDFKKTVHIKKKKKLYERNLIFIQCHTLYLPRNCKERAH